MAQLKLDEESKKIVTLQLMKLNMQDYQEQVEKVMMGKESPGDALQLIATFHNTGYLKGLNYGIGKGELLMSQRVKDILESGK